jgi:hypothetical protein
MLPPFFRWQEIFTDTQGLGYELKRIVNINKDTII